MAQNMGGGDDGAGVSVVVVVGDGEEGQDTDRDRETGLEGQVRLDCQDLTRTRSARRQVGVGCSCRGGTFATGFFLNSEIQRRERRCKWRRWWSWRRWR